MTIAKNLAKVRAQIEVAAKRCGRNPNSIKLISVSKTKTTAEIMEAINASQLAFGENYAQELRDKNSEITKHYALNTKHCSIEWHFIGHLQRNKIKYVLPVASWIHTIDSAELLDEINRKLHVILNEAKDLPHIISRDSSPPTAVQSDQQVINCLIEVNIAGESSKSGINPEKVFDLVKVFSAIEPSNHRTIALKGLMCMPPPSDNPETSRPYFKKLKSLLDEINSRNIYPEKLTELSMGMTQDFEVAIEEGSTMLRIGTAIFGSR